MESGVRKYLYIASAAICVAMGTVGMFLPILPTTPFLLLAIWLFMRSSMRGVKMVMGNRWLSPYVRSYFSRNGIPAHRLKRFLLTLWLTLFVGMLVFRSNLHVVGILAVVGVGVSLHLYSKREKNNQLKKL